MSTGRLLFFSYVLFIAVYVDGLHLKTFEIDFTDDSHDIIHADCGQFKDIVCTIRCGFRDGLADKYNECACVCSDRNVEDMKKVEQYRKRYKNVARYGEKGY
ncbi:unnamed protein product [Bursaphelenchus okinawaensis]|uniref:Invertebrate defensins family profile domain-containing protein n=1 Tax=Bursaphelenchus okinawaensis TaxID=465554 RepID=A0A811LHY5_9BILA|nr:unnamed protein product [Bursaphelenchus okinawaensis]CAG9123573.1 unnamed protein product [Bursaphelenchus okinawaensis]